jgi:hypothetical protein
MLEPAGTAGTVGSRAANRREERIRNICMLGIPGTTQLTRYNGREDSVVSRFWQLNAKYPLAPASVRIGQGGDRRGPIRKILDSLINDESDTMDPGVLHVMPNDRTLRIASPT